MTSANDWLKDAKTFDVDFDRLQMAFPETTDKFKTVFEDLREVQKLHKELYELGYKSKLSSVTAEAIDREAQQYRQTIHDLVGLLKEPKRPSNEARRLINEASVRKREMRFYASQYLPFLLLKEERQDFESQEGIAEAGHVFDKYLDEQNPPKNFWKKLNYGGCVYSEQAKRWLAWRSVWLGLVFVVYVIVLVLLAAIYLEWNWFFIPQGIDVNDFGDLAAIKLLLLPLVTVPLIGFVFSNRNYRIYAHLAEVYTHRDASIKLLLAIMKNDTFNRQWTDSKERLAVINEAAIMLFKHRTNGHLRSKESDTSLVSKITNINE